MWYYIFVFQIYRWEQRLPFYVRQTCSKRNSNIAVQLWLLEQYTTHHINTRTYIHTHVYIHTYTHNHTHTLIHPYTHIYVYTYTYIHTYTHTHTHTHIRTHTHNHTHSYTHTHTHTSKCNMYHLITSLTLSKYFETSPMFSLLMTGMLGSPSTPMDLQHPLTIEPGTSYQQG